VERESPRSVPKEAAALLESEVKTWARVITERGMKADLAVSPVAAF